jgi:hypothetical protein
MSAFKVAMSEVNDSMSDVSPSILSVKAAMSFFSVLIAAEV